VPVFGQPGDLTQTQLALEQAHFLVGQQIRGCLSSQTRLARLEAIARNGATASLAIGLGPVVLAGIVSGNQSRDCHYTVAILSSNETSVVNGTRVFQIPNLEKQFLTLVSRHARGYGVDRKSGQVWIRTSASARMRKCSGNREDRTILCQEIWNLKTKSKRSPGWLNLK
jgi:hypothetical protein